MIRPQAEKPALVIGTRGSPLALAQAEETRKRLIAAHPELDDGAIHIRVIRTSGDRIQDRTLAESGGKGLFTKEIEEALAEGSVDLAVHSMKDMPTQLPPGLIMAAYLPREDHRDGLLSLTPTTLDALPVGSVVGTASLRRAAFLLHRRPDLQLVPLRGNVQTRMRKLEEGHVAATFLALAGLKRLGLSPDGLTPLSEEDMLPAVAQGCIGIECREDDARVLALLAPLDDAPTRRRIEAERLFLAMLDGSCRTPIAGLAEILHDGMLRFRGAIARPDGSEMLSIERIGGNGLVLAREAADDLRRRGGAEFFKA